MGARLRSSIGRRAIVPEWLLDSGISSTAIRLFAVLDAKYADRSGEAFPSRRTLASDLSTSVDTIDRAIRELVEAEALSVERRKDGGAFTSSLYYLVHEAPGGRMDAARGSRTDAARVAAGVAAPVRHQYPVVTPSLSNPGDQSAKDAGDCPQRHCLRERGHPGACVGGPTLRKMPN